MTFHTIPLITICRTMLNHSQNPQALSIPLSSCANSLQQADTNSYTDNAAPFFLIPRFWNTRNTARSFIGCLLFYHLPVLIRSPASTARRNGGLQTSRNVQILLCRVHATWLTIKALPSVTDGSKCFMKNASYQCKVMNDIRIYVTWFASTAVILTAVLNQWWVLTFSA